MIIRWLLTPYFIALLIILDIPTFLLLSWVKIAVYRSFVLAASLLAVALLSLFIYTPTTPSLSERDVHINETVSYLEELHQQQPTDRDVLINLSRMTFFMERIEESQLYYQAAFQLDPNSEEFRRP